MRRIKSLKANQPSSSKKSPKTAAQPRTRGVFRSLGWVALAAVAGGAQYLSYQPIGWFLAAPIAVALVLIAVDHAHSWKWAALTTFAWALTTAATTLPWIASFVGAAPWLALSVVLGILAIPTGITLWIVLRSGLPKWARYLGSAFLFIAAEQLLAHWPFGGFPWLRLAWGQINGPLADTVSLGGVALVSLLVALVGAGIFALTHRSFLSGVALIVLPIIGALTLPNLLAPMPQSPDRELRVAAVQGNVPRLGLEFNAQRRAVLQNHVDATNDFARDVREGRAEQPDVVIWPENSSDVSPFRDSTAARLIDEAAANIGAPIVVGTFSYDNGVQNTMVVWDPRTGAGEQHDKIYLQPFGETMPFRDVLRHVTDLVDLAGNMTPGTGNGVVHIPLIDSDVALPLGLATCYEVVFDGAYRSAVAGGATMLATPTNNATFGFTDMTYQQMAMSRMRAKEFQRSTVVVATSGVSGMIDAKGQVSQQTEIFEQKVLTATVPQYSHLTPAARYGRWVDIAVTVVAILFLLAALVSQAKIGRQDSRARVAAESSTA